MVRDDGALKAGVEFGIGLRVLLMYMWHDDQLSQNNDIRLQHLSALVGYLGQYKRLIKSVNYLAFGKCGKSRLQPTFYPPIKVLVIPELFYSIRDITYEQERVDFMRNNQRHYPRTPRIFFRNVKLYVIHDKPVKEENCANISRIVMLAGSIILGL